MKPACFTDLIALTNWNMRFICISSLIYFLTEVLCETFSIITYRYLIQHFDFVIRSGGMNPSQEPGAAT